MAERFYLAESIDDGETWLEGFEAHHLLHVMRAGPGDEVTLFDGTGVEYAARVLRCERRRVLLQIDSRTEVDRELSFALQIAVALPKADLQRWLVEKCVELGVARLTPLVTSRGVAQPTEQALERLKRTVVEACKQCGRNRLMEVSLPQTWSDHASRPRDNRLRWIAQPGGPPPAMSRIEPPAEGIVAAIGPEGGWTDEEVELARQNGWTIVGLGPRILRVETAVVALAALLGSLAEGT
jgi:16S rRNA (uracil1498-N3)-methyltransferase